MSEAFFGGKNKKNINLSYAELAQSVVKVKMCIRDRTVNGSKNFIGLQKFNVIMKASVLVN